MKYLMICILFFVTACNNIQSKDDLNGVYAASSENEFGKTDDTLILSKANNGQGIYQIIRHMGVTRKLDGKEYPKEIIAATWTLRYNPEEKTLFELQKGKTLIWNSDSQTLKLGITNYNRIVTK